MELSVVAFVLLAAAALVGSWLVWRGLRGRVVDDHPFCRRCGFDLFGLPDASTRCPECGSDLSAKAIRIGRREVRGRALAGGIALIVPWTLLVAAIGVAWFNGVDVNRYKPISWLTRQADAAAVGELSRRQMAGELSDDQFATVMNAALAAQADKGRPWLTGWGDMIERARINGKLSDERWQTYAKQAAPLKLVARPRVRVGDPIPIEVRFDGARAANRSRLDIHLRVLRATIEDTRLGGLLPEDTSGGSVGKGLSGQPSGWVTKEVLRIPGADLARHVGKGRTVRAEVIGAVYDGQGSPGLDRQVCALDQVLTDTITVVPENEPTVELVRGDATMRDRLAQIIKVESNTRGKLVTSSGPVLHVDRGSEARLRVRANSPPIGLAFRVILRDRRAREFPLNAIDFRPNVISSWFAATELDGFDADVVDVVLRPSPVRAAETVELTRIWDEELVFPDVPVYWEEGVTRPTTLPAWRKRRGGSRPPPDWFWNKPRS
jgi:hypothetical protein